jgi:hypothetical protein
LATHINIYERIDRCIEIERERERERERVRERASERGCEWVGGGEKKKAKLVLLQ